MVTCPLAHVQEIHLAGHTRQTDDDGHPLLIDTHDRPVDEVAAEQHARKLWSATLDFVTFFAPRRFNRSPYPGAEFLRLSRCELRENRRSVEMSPKRARFVHERWLIRS